ncbi:MAG: type III pantothenate kinase [Gammaproteobacteria bacterium]
MLLCLDIGNTHILGGVFQEGQLVLRFRYATTLIGTADQFGIFLLNILQANQLDPKRIEATAVCSVVPSIDFTIRHTMTQYFSGTPHYVLRAGVKTGLNIKYKNPNEVGADRIANSIGAVNAFPNQNIIVIDMGTATTLCAINKNKDYLGGAILPGLRLSMESLKSNTAKLMEVNIEAPTGFVGRTTRESIQSGLYYGQLGALRELIAGFKQEVFSNEPVKVIGTGGFARLYKDKALYDVLLPDLVLQGMLKAYEYSIVEE